MLKKSEHLESGIPVFGIENIGFLKFLWDTKIHITHEKASQLSQYAILPGDVIISRSGTVGEVCVVPDTIREARFSTNLIRVALNSEIIDPQYFCFLFKGSQFVLDQVREFCKGSTRDFLNQSILKAISFPLPLIEEQRIIVQKVQRVFDFTDKIEKQYQKVGNYTDQLTQAILAKAFRGELVPQDPNDEPASELPKRIKSDRERSKKEPKIQKGKSMPYK